jgi:membrane protease YdiL (CAAX protease family)
MEHQYRGSRSKISLRATGKSIIAILMLTIVAMTILMLVTLIYGVSIVGPAIIDGTGHLDRYGIFVVLPIFVTVLTLSGYSLFAYYIFLLFAIVASVAWVFATSARMFVKEMQGKGKPREHSSLFDTFALLCATLFFTYATVLLVILIQGDTGTTPSTGTLADTLFLLANAAVWEEIAVRVLLIGIPLLIIDTILRYKFRNKPYRYILGGGFKFGVVETVLVVISAIVFGIAHWVGGWPAWKIPDATVAGLAFGYLFLKYGLPSAILLHFANDYLTMPTEVFDSSTGGLGILTILLVLFWALLGSVLFAYYVIRVIEFFSNKTFFENKPAGVGIPGIDPRLQGPYPQPYSYAPHQQIQPAYQAQTGVVTPGPTVGHGYSGGYVCPSCGYTQARWSEGKFQCLRCGKVA